jgi:hypothetical protein
MFFSTFSGAHHVALRIETTQRGPEPIVTCDHCGERITDALDGTYEWAGVTAAPGERVALYLLHKRCSPAFERHHGLILNSMVRAVLLPYLAQAMHLNWDQARTHAEVLNEH